MSPNQMKKITTILAAVALAFGAQQTFANNTTHSLLGIDVSHYQGGITWSSVYADGVRYAVAKATESTGYTDPNFSSYASGAKGAGLKFSAYHFAITSAKPLHTPHNHTIPLKWSFLLIRLTLLSSLLFRTELIRFCSIDLIRPALSPPDPWTA
jgi:hypothetical protein